MHLLWLPNELLELIVAHVNVDDIEDVGLCCHRLRNTSLWRLEEHRLYRRRFQTVRLGPQYELCSDGVGFKATCAQQDFEGHPVNLLLAIRNNRRIARYIRSLHFAAGDALYFARESGLRPATRANLTRMGWLVEVLGDMGVEGAWSKHAFASRRYTDTYTGPFDTSTMFAYLLTLTRHLKDVSLSPGHENVFAKQAWKIFEHQATTSDHLLLSQLERVSVLDKARRSELCTTFLPFIRWTGVKKLHARGARNHEHKLGQLAVYAGPTVEAIDLEDSLVSDATLDALLQHCPGLVSLRYVAGTTASAKNRTNDKLRPGHLIPLLETHCGATLQRLSLDVTDLNHAVAFKLESFQGLSNLRVLSVHASHYFADGDQEAPWLSETPAEALARLLGVLPASIEALVVKFGRPREHGTHAHDDELAAQVERELLAMRQAFQQAQQGGLRQLRRGTCICSHRKWSLAA